MNKPNDAEALRIALADIARLAGLWSETCEAASDLSSAELMEHLGRIAPQVMAAIAARAAFALEQEAHEAEDFEMKLVDLFAGEAYLGTGRNRASVRDEG